MDEKPVMLSGAHITRAIKDENFYKLLPQFLPIKTKLAAMHSNIKSGGCSSCKQRRIVVNIERDFAAIASSLDKSAGAVLRKYLGVGRLLVHAVNPRTNAAYLKDI